MQKTFYSLIHERRIGEYYLPDGSIVVGAVARAQDSAIVRPMSSALLNRMIYVHLMVSHRDWLDGPTRTASTSWSSITSGTGPITCSRSRPSTRSRSLRRVCGTC